MIAYVLPSVDPLYRVACLDSLAEHVRQRVLVLDNAKHNRGVAASWNAGIRRAVNMGADWLVIMSESVRFGDAGACDLEEELHCDPGSQWVDATLGWHLVAFRTWVLKRVGFFDENFWPAYMEDSDYLVRLHLAGCASPRRDEFPALFNDEPGRRQLVGLDVADLGTEHSIRQRCTRCGLVFGDVVPERCACGGTPGPGFVAARFTACLEYYKSKWGERPPGYKYEHPFDRPDLDWRWWPT